MPVNAYGIILGYTVIDQWLRVSTGLSAIPYGSLFSLRNGFTAYFVLSPVTGLFCHRRLADNSAKLDASVGASGPHGFAVHKQRSRQQRRPRPSHPAPNVRDVRNAPLSGRDGGACTSDLGQAETEIFLRRGLDRIQ